MKNAFSALAFAFVSNKFLNALYFPTQALNFAFKDKIQGMFNTPKTAPQWQKFGTNITSGGLAGSLSLLGVYSLDFARTRLGNDAASGKGGKRQFNGLLDVYKQTIKTDGLAGLYRGFGISVVGIFIYRGLYFGLYDSCKPIFFKGQENPSAVGTFCLSLGTTSIAGIMAYPIDTVRLEMCVAKFWTRMVRLKIHLAVFRLDLGSWFRIYIYFGLKLL